jgi:K+-transporting ATPase KdpF subunit
MTPQTVIYTLAAIVAAALLIYLIIALLKPEWFH